MNSGFPGAQSPYKITQLLKILAGHHARGLNLKEVTQASGLDRSTTRRLLQVLTATGLAAKDEASGKYALGVDAMYLGIAALGKAPVIALCQPLLQRLCEATGDTVFLIVRVGDFAYCLHVELGQHPLPHHATMVGQAKVLGLGTGSLALAADIPDQDLARIFERRQMDYQHAGIEWDRLHTMVRSTRIHGFSFSTNLLTHGASGVAVPVDMGSNHVIAISISTHTLLMNQDHKYRVLKLMKNEIEQHGFHIKKYSNPIH